MTFRQLATLRRSWTRRTRCSPKINFSTQVEDEPLAQSDIEPSVSTDIPPHDPLPEENPNLVGIKRRRGAFQNLKNQFEGLGSVQTPEGTWKPHHSLFKPTPPSSITMSALIAAGAHLGHSKSLANPAFMPYAYGTRAGITLIDLDATLPLLRRAAALVRSVAFNDGTVVFVGTRPNLKQAVRFAAERMGENAYYVGDKWLPGTFTNRVQLLGADVSSTQRVIPDLVVFLNPIPNLHAIRECAISHVPTIGIIDSNVDPRIVMYPIPANDESPRTVELISGVLSIAGREGVELRKLEMDRYKNFNEGLRFKSSNSRTPGDYIEHEEVQPEDDQPS